MTIRLVVSGALAQIDLRLDDCSNVWIGASTRLRRPHSIRTTRFLLTNDWFDVVMSTRVNDPKRTAKVVVMQRCHQRDLSGHLLEHGGWEHLCLPAEYEGGRCATSIGWSDPRAAHAELLWPDRFGPDEIAWLKKSLGSYGAAGQLQQRPSPAEGGIIKRTWWRYYQPLGADLPPVIVRHPDGTNLAIAPIVLERGRGELIQSWECSFKDLATSDYVVGQVWGNMRPNFYLLEQVRGRMDFPATLGAIRGMSSRWPAALAKLIEDKANGSAVIQGLNLNALLVAH